MDIVKHRLYFMDKDSKGLTTDGYLITISQIQTGSKRMLHVILGKYKFQRCQVVKYLNVFKKITRSIFQRQEITLWLSIIKADNIGFRV